MVTSMTVRGPSSLASGEFLEITGISPPPSLVLMVSYGAQVLSCSTLCTPLAGFMFLSCGGPSVSSSSSSSRVSITATSEPRLFLSL